MGIWWIYIKHTLKSQMKVLNAIEDEEKNKEKHIIAIDLQKLY